MRHPWRLRPACPRAPASTMSPDVEAPEEARGLPWQEGYRRGYLLVCLSCWLFVCLSCWLLVCLSCWLPVCLSCWLLGCSSCWLLGCLSCWLLVCLSCWLLVCLSCWLLGCLAACLLVCCKAYSIARRGTTPWTATPPHRARLHHSARAVQICFLSAGPHTTQHGACRAHVLSTEQLSFTTQHLSSFTTQHGACVTFAGPRLRRRRAGVHGSAPRQAGQR
jgi:hypothetical protein